ncbi:TPA: hypothetical protein DF272_04230 [Candidatus Falkowbacteria bacterium]|nr:hypothetical protein [Candidatus Falkowbacteria bacterium]
MDKIKHFFIHLLWPTILRFPVVIAVGLIASGLMIYSLEKNLSPENSPSDETIFCLLLIFILAIPFYFIAKLFLETKKFSPAIQVLAYFVPTALLTGYFSKIKYFHPIWENDQSALEYALLFLSLIMLASVIYLLPRKLNSFWLLNKKFVTRLFLSGLFTLIAWIGLMLALTAINYLFNLHIDSEKYFEILAVLIGVFTIPFFLTGVPHIDEFETEIKYPKWLKFCSQYILTPLLGVYFIILYAYSFKIVFTQTWPKDGIVFWIMLYVGLAFVIYLFTRPLFDQKWHRFISISFLISALPLYILYFIAIIIRVDQYGLTINRYAVVLFALWSIGNIVYFTFSRKKYLFVFSLSIIAACLIFLYGPWSSYNLSYTSQIARFGNLLTEKGLLIDDRLVPATEKFTYDDYYDLESQTSYLFSHYDWDKITRWLGDSNISMLETNAKKNFTDQATYEKTQIFLDGLNIENDNIYRSQFNQIQRHLKDIVYPISGYDYFADTGEFTMNGGRSIFPANNLNQNLQLSLVDTDLSIYQNDVKIITLSLKDKLLALSTDTKTTGLDLNTMSLDAENDKIKVRLILHNVYFELTDDNTFNLISLNLKLAYSLK